MWIIRRTFVSLCILLVAAVISAATIDPADMAVDVHGGAGLTMFITFLGFHLGGMYLHHRVTKNSRANEIGFACFRTAWLCLSVGVTLVLAKLIHPNEISFASPGVLLLAGLLWSLTMVALTYGDARLAEAYKAKREAADKNGNSPS